MPKSGSTPGLRSPISRAESRQRVGGSIEIYVDSGIRRGSDILKALALGADACSAGVGRIIEIFADELRRTMTLVGDSSISEWKARGGEILRDIRHSGEILETTASGNTH